MARVTGFTAERMLQIENSTVVSGFVDADHHLVLELRDGTEIDAGYVRGENATALLTKLDTDSVKISLNGLGTPQQPWVLSADVTGFSNTGARYGLLPPEYRGGNTRVKVDGVYTAACEWLTPYDPRKSRQVRVTKVGRQDVIIGQREHDQVVIELNRSAVVNYNEATAGIHFSPEPRAVRLPSGLVVLTGLLQTVKAPANGEALAYLPPGFRPGEDMLVGVEVENQPRALAIRANGEIQARTNISNGNYISIDNLSFYAAGVPQWSDIGTMGTSYGSNFEAWPEQWAAYGTPGFWEDPYGWLWFRGLVRAKATQSVDNTTIFNLPSNLRVSLEQHVRGTSENGLGMYGGNPTLGLTWKTGSAGGVGHYFSMGGVAFALPRAFSDNRWMYPYRFENNWVNRDGTRFTPLSWCLREDGLRALRGLVNSGTSPNTRITIMHEAEMIPDSQLVMATVAQSQGRGRLDIAGRKRESPGLGSLQVVSAPASSWFSLDQVFWVV